MKHTIYSKDNAVITNKKIEKLENSAVKLSLTVGKEYVASEYGDLLKKYGKDIQIKGFRKGKVPRRYWRENSEKESARKQWPILWTRS